MWLAGREKRHRLPSKLGCRPSQRRLGNKSRMLDFGLKLNEKPLVRRTRVLNVQQIVQNDLNLATKKNDELMGG